MLAGNGAINDTFKVKLADGKQHTMKIEIQVAQNEEDQVTNYFGTVELQPDAN